MKVFLLTIILSLACAQSQAQLRNIGRKIKNDAEWRVRQKVDQQVNRALDSAVSKATKPNAKKTPGQENGSSQQPPPEQSPVIQ